MEFNLKGPSAGPINQTTQFTILVTDSGGNALQANTNDFTVKVSGPSSSSPVVGRTPYGTYAFNLIPTSTGQYSIDVYHKGEFLFNERFLAKEPVVQTIEVFTQVQFDLDGTGLKGGRVGESVQFTIKTADIQNGGRADVKVHELECNISGSQSLRPRVSGGYPFVVEYSVQQPGHYYIDVTWNGKSIMSQGPTKVLFEERASPRHCVISASSGCNAGSTFNFTIKAIGKTGYASSTGGEPFEVAIEGPQNKFSSPEIVDNRNGTYNVACVFYNAHSSYSVSVFIYGQQLQNSPFTVKTY